MAQPKRKQSKQRSRKRRGSIQFDLPHLAKDPQDGTAPPALCESCQWHYREDIT